MADSKRVAPGIQLKSTQIICHTFNCFTVVLPFKTPLQTALWDRLREHDVAHPIWNLCSRLDPTYIFSSLQPDFRIFCVIFWRLKWMSGQVQTPQKKARVDLTRHPLDPSSEPSQKDVRCVYVRWYMLISVSTAINFFRAKFFDLLSDIIKRSIFLQGFFNYFLFFFWSSSNLMQNVSFLFISKIHLFPISTP